MNENEPYTITKQYHEKKGVISGLISLIVALII